MIILFTILWIVYSCLDGIAQGFYYDLYPFQKGHPDIHWVFTIQRFITCLSMTLALLHFLEIYQGIIFMFSCFLMFSFFHNGLYYLIRNTFNDKIYKKGFWDDSDSSMAVLNIGVKFRTAMLVVGLAFIIGLIYEHNVG